MSDLHLLCLDGAVPFRLFNKRMTGYMNLRLHRQSVHRPFAARAAARAIRKLEIDHVVITGDVTNLALEVEVDVVRAFLLHDLAFPPDRLSIVPGNHDVYTRGAHRSARFARGFSEYLDSDIPTGGTRDQPFPVVRLRGPVALIGLSTAVPRPPFVASGALGHAQIAALVQVLAHPEVSSRFAVVLQHHPIHNARSAFARAFAGLHDAEAEVVALSGLRRGLLLHGHLHRRCRRRVTTSTGELDAIGATSATLIHKNQDRMAGFNVYEIDNGGALRTVESHCIDPKTEEFRLVDIPSS